MNFEETDPVRRQKTATHRFSVVWFDRLLVAQFVLILSIMTVSIFFRYVLNHSLTWTDEAVRYLFVWFTLLGSSLVLRDRAHIRVEFLIENLSPRLRNVFDYVSDVLVLLFNLVLIVLGVQWAVAVSGTYTSALHLPISIALYAAVPVSASINVVFLLQTRRVEEPES